VAESTPPLRRITASLPNIVCGLGAFRPFHRVAFLIPADEALI
jgi:hypothetical protein